MSHFLPPDAPDRASLSSDEAVSSQPSDTAQAGQTPPKEKRPGAFGADINGWLQALAFALVFLLILFTFVGRVIGVDGHSMDPTLNDKDMLFLRNFSYHPQQGDIVVLHKDFADITTPIVKRVIATGGQTVEIDYDRSTVYVDGQPLEEDYILEPMLPPSTPYAQGTYWEVPEGCVFVMGDNRNNSSDSRDERLGPIDERYILGNAVATLLPFPHAGLIG